jgi:hypothetical protein
MEDKAQMLGMFLPVNVPFSNVNCRRKLTNSSYGVHHKSSDTTTTGSQGPEFPLLCCEVCRLCISNIIGCSCSIQ